MALTSLNRVENTVSIKEIDGCMPRLSDFRGLGKDTVIEDLPTKYSVSATVPVASPLRREMPV